MIQINLKSLNKESLDIYANFIGKILKNLNVRYSSVNMPTKVKKLTLLKAPHVYKAAREQFIVKSYKTLIVLKSKVDSNKLRLLILNKPKTVKIRIKR
jgi:small subunit ribosomal protein S10